jgi:hypothetical protein
VTKWTYVPTTVQGMDDGTWKNVNVRFTLQASARNKFNFFWDEQRLCTQCLSASNSVTTAPEAHYNNHAPPRVQQVTWSSPWTNRLLFEAGLGTNLIDGYGTRPNISNYADMIRSSRRATSGCASNGGIPIWRIDRRRRRRSSGRMKPTATSTAGAHRRRSCRVATPGKVGYIGQQIVNHFATVTMNDQWLSYGFQNGRPNTFIQWAGPGMQNTHVQTHAIYVQDSWTAGR